MCYYNMAMRLRLAGVAELADAQDLKSCGIFSRTGSIPVSGTTLYVIKDKKVNIILIA